MIAIEPMLSVYRVYRYGAARAARVVRLFTGSHRDWLRGSRWQSASRALKP